MWKGFNKTAVTVMLCLVICAMFANSFIPALSEGGDAQRCAYVGEYDCQNEARLDDEKYPAINGERYCKIHWKQLAEEEGITEG